MKNHVSFPLSELGGRSKARKIRRQREIGKIVKPILKPALPRTHCSDSQSRAFYGLFDFESPMRNSLGTTKSFIQDLNSNSTKFLLSSFSLRILM